MTHVEFICADCGARVIRFDVPPDCAPLDRCYDCTLVRDLALPPDEEMGLRIALGCEIAEHGDG
jgi:hypothetical protein